MFDLKKKSVVHEIEPAVIVDNVGVAAQADERQEPSLNIDPPAAIEPIVEKVGLGWFPGMKATTPTGRAPRHAETESREFPAAAAAAAARTDDWEPTAAQSFEDVGAESMPRDPAPASAQSFTESAPQNEFPRQDSSPAVSEAFESVESVETAESVESVESVSSADPSVAESVHAESNAPDGGKQDIPQFGLPVDTRNSSPKIGAILIANGKMTEEHVQTVLAQQEREPNARFGELAVKNRFVSQKDVDDALASQFGFSSNSQSSHNLAPEIVVAHNPFSPFSEALRGLRSQLMLRWFDGSPQQGALAMTSVDRNDGKSFICANLGVVFSQLGEKTLIIDADLRNSTQHLKFGVQNRMGLSGVLSGRAGVEEILAVPGLSNLAVLPAGPLPPNPQELLGREDFSQFLAAMSSTFDVILIDTPSAQQASDAQVVAQRARAALIVGRKDKTKSSEIAQLGAVMTSSGVKLLGATLNSY